MAHLRLLLLQAWENLSEGRLVVSLRLQLVFYCLAATGLLPPCPLCAALFARGCLWPREVLRLSVLTTMRTTAKHDTDQAGTQCQDCSHSSKTAQAQPLQM